jgi:hypothetical protein
VSQVTEARPVGRPSKYDPKYCEALIADAREGLSLTAFAGGIGVARSTINEWIEHHPEFSEAVKQHAAIRTRCLETGLLSAEMGPRVTARIFALKNAAPDEWKDKIAHVGGDESDKPIEHAVKVSFVKAGG